MKTILALLALTLLLLGPSLLVSLFHRFHREKRFRDGYEDNINYLCNGTYGPEEIECFATSGGDDYDRGALQAVRDWRKSYE